MSEISALESRITAALDRIRHGVDGLGAASAVSDTDALNAQLTEERTANAQLEERVKALKARQDTRIAELEARVEAQKMQVASMDAELQGLRASNADMRQMNAQLRDAVTKGVSEPELVNRAMMAEVDALQAQRSADAGEVDAILAELKPLVEGQ